MSDNYDKYVLSTIKSYFSSNYSNLNWEQKCNGKGECYTNVPGTYVYYRLNYCENNCSLEKCPNFILCENYFPKCVQDNYYGLCYHCSLAYKPSGQGRGKLQTLENYDCENCKVKTTCIEQAFCEHKLCIKCFKLVHYKPGNDKCPICHIGNPLI